MILRMMLRWPAVAAFALVVALTPVKAQDNAPPPGGAPPEAASPGGATPAPAAPNDAAGNLPAAKADAAPVKPSSRRFQFSQVGDSMLRLDGETGQVALCGPRSVGWGCQVLPEDRAALEAEISRLQSEMNALKQEIAGLKAPPPAPSPPPAAQAPSAAPEIKLPTAEDLQRARAFVENAWRKFVDMVTHLQKDMMRKG